MKLLGGRTAFVVSDIFVSPRFLWGFMIQFDVRIFFKWVGMVQPPPRVGVAKV